MSSASSQCVYCRCMKADILQPANHHSHLHAASQQTPLCIQTLLCQSLSRHNRPLLIPGSHHLVHSELKFSKMGELQRIRFFFISGGPTALRPLNTVVHSFCHCRFRTFMVIPVLLISLGGDLWVEKFQWPQIYEDLSSPVVQAQSSHPSGSLGLFIQRVAVRD